MCFGKLFMLTLQLTCVHTTCCNAFGRLHLFSCHGACARPGASRRRRIFHFCPAAHPVGYYFACVRGLQQRHEFCACFIGLHVDICSWCARMLPGARHLVGCLISVVPLHVDICSWCARMPSGARHLVGCLISVVLPAIIQSHASFGSSS